MDKLIAERMKLLRAEGRSLSEISRTVNIPKTTVHLYVSKTRVKDQFLKSLKAKRGGSITRRDNAKLIALENGRSLISSLNHKEKLLNLHAILGKRK